MTRTKASEQLRVEDAKARQFCECLRRNEYSDNATRVHRCLKCGKQTRREEKPGNLFLGEPLSD